MCDARDSFPFLAVACAGFSNREFNPSITSFPFLLLCPLSFSNAVIELDAREYCIRFTAL